MATHDDRLWRLHLRRSLGEALTADERSDLDAWYAEQDQAEALALGLSSEVNDLSPLKQQVDAILERIVTTWLERYRQLAGVLDQLVEQQAELIREQRALLTEQRTVLQRLFDRLE